jgi:hypothetical protein
MKYSHYQPQYSEQLLIVPGIIIIENKINLDRKETIRHEVIVTEEINAITRKLYNQPNGTITILIALYLFLNLIVVVKIISILRSPIRQTKQ